MNKKFQELTCKLDVIFDNFQERSSSSSLADTEHRNINENDHQDSHNLRLKVPRFDGSMDAQDWIFKVEQFFDFYDMNETQRLRIAPFYFEGEALSWYQWLKKNTTITSWPMFLQSLQVRFGSSEWEDYQGQLAKLTQQGSVIDYQEKFETLSNKVNGLSESFLLSCFIYGLKTITQHKVNSFRPTTLTNAIALAKIQEAKLACKYFYPKLHSPYPPLLPTPTNTPITNPSSSKNPVSNNTNIIQPKETIQRLTQSQIQERRDKNLCFTCGEKYFRGHKCKAYVHILIVPDEEYSLSADANASEELMIPDQEPLLVQHETPQISFHALSGFVVPQTLRFHGHIGKSEMLLLVDEGSTHNFLQPQMVSSLHLPMSTDRQFDVMVGNGQVLKCQGFCAAVPVKIHQHIFLVDFQVLPIQGVDMVLGVQWPQLLGPIAVDYQRLTMEFTWEGEVIKLQGEQHSSPFSLNQFKKIHNSGQIASLYQLTVIDSQQTVPNEVMSPQIQQLLVEFEGIFQKPTKLPPHQDLNHEIHLEIQSQPVNVKPYSQKERWLMEILYRLRALNSITIKDRFPIPIADELMDELGGSKKNSKLDLRAWYHQIRVHPPDIHKTAFRTHQGHYEFLPIHRRSLATPLVGTYYIAKIISFISRKANALFTQQSVEYLGHIVSAEGVNMDKSKV
ncbi:uncharacterized protein LOC133290697 [Gastrolobium bilobum]|uniref:uncharacterized protein LOC133290697 n=1 Tax=Gastrolobium bilobum TaxID=150636 RepID=UPI002AAFF4E9|nr:uncharacterized protein LOC133290697 [Gastrolobium bilobum]